MAVLGMGLLWSSYTLVFWGWSLVKGYDLSLAQIVKPTAYTGAWPPPSLPDTVVLRATGSPAGSPGPADNTISPGAAGSIAGQDAFGGGSTGPTIGGQDLFGAGSRGSRPSQGSTNKAGLL